MHNDQRFDRELVHAVISCRAMEYKVTHVDLSLGGGRTVSRQRTESHEPARRSAFASPTLEINGTVQAG